MRFRTATLAVAAVKVLQRQQGRLGHLGSEVGPARRREQDPLDHLGALVVVLLLLKGAAPQISGDAPQYAMARGLRTVHTNTPRRGAGAPASPLVEVAGAAESTFAFAGHPPTPGRLAR